MAASRPSRPILRAAQRRRSTCAGKIVAPGLLDIHTHAARVKDGPELCLADGVTGFVDAGSQGADSIEEIIAVAKSAPQPARVLINIGRAGILPTGDTMDVSRADVGAARERRSARTATSSPASRRDCRKRSPAPTTTRC